MYRKRLKRIFDLAFSVAGMVLLSPLLAIFAGAVRVGLGSPVLFRQLRPGLGGVLFKVAKFRSMSDARDKSGNLLSDEERLTRLGRFMRSTSLDELPMLWNVIKGDMSMVGPRPLLMEYVPRFSAEQARRHEVRPGITGWAQVNGRNATTWDERLRLDVWYVDHASFWLDLRILARTLWLVLRREGISAAGHATMPPFLGGGETRNGR